MKRIYFQDEDEDEATPCEVDSSLLPYFKADGCDNDFSWLIEDTETRTTWLVCTPHKEEIKALGIAK